MTKNQIYNLFCFVGVMTLDMDIMLTSPDYLDEKTISSAIRKAVADVISEGKVRTYDMMKMAGRPEVVNNGAASTSQMTDAIIARLK